MSTLRSLVSSRTFWAGMALVTLYWIMAAFVPIAILTEVVNYGLFALAIGVVVAYWPAWLSAVCMSRPTPEFHLILGIGLAWTGGAIIRGWWAFSIVFDRANLILVGEWFSQAVLGFGLWVAALGATLHITAPDSINGRIPPRQRVLLGAIVAGWLLAVGVLLAVYRAPEIFSLSPSPSRMPQIPIPPPVVQ